MSPPRKWCASGERPSRRRPLKALSSPRQTEMCAWQPDPVRLANGFGMKVARMPCFSAMVRTMYLKNTWRSAVTSAGA